MALLILSYVIHLPENIKIAHQLVDDLDSPQVLGRRRQRPRLSLCTRPKAPLLSVAATGWKGDNVSSPVTFPCGHGTVDGWE